MPPTPALADLDEFTTAYIEAALWSSMDESDDRGGEPMDANYDETDLVPATLAEIIEDCRRFQAENAADLERCEELEADGEWSCPGECSVLEYAGHDFWLTRNGHGCGFWDGDWPDEIGERLDKAAGAFGECNLYVGDDGLIYS